MRYRQLLFLIPCFLLLGCFESDDKTMDNNETLGKSLSRSVIFDTTVLIKKSDTLFLPITLKEGEPYVIYINGKKYTSNISVMLKDSAQTTITDNKNKPYITGCIGNYSGSYTFRTFLKNEDIDIDEDSLTIKIEQFEKLSSDFEGTWYLHERSFTVPKGESYHFTMPDQGASGYWVQSNSRFAIQGDSVYYSTMDNGFIKYTDLNFLDKDVKYYFNGDTLIFNKSVHSGDSASTMTVRYLQTSNTIDELCTQQENYHFEVPDSFKGCWYLAKKIKLYYDPIDLMTIRQYEADSISESVELFKINENSFDLYLRESSNDTIVEISTRSLDHKGGNDWVHPWGYLKDDQLIMGWGYLSIEYGLDLYIYNKYDGPLPPKSWTE